MKKRKDLFNICCESKQNETESNLHAILELTNFKIKYCFFLFNADCTLCQVKTLFCRSSFINESFKSKLRSEIKDSEN